MALNLNQQINDLIEKSNHILITTGSKDKGDGIASALTLKLIWMQESLIDTIDMQAKAESEAGELKDKLSRAVSLLEKMKEKMGKK